MENFSHLYIFLFELIFIINNLLALKVDLCYNLYSSLDVESHSPINKICIVVTLSLIRQKEAHINKSPFNDNLL